MDRRATPRFPAWERAVIRWGEDGPAMRALIQDVSQGGARIEVAERLAGDEVTVHLRYGDERMEFVFHILGTDSKGATKVIRGEWGVMDPRQKAFLWNVIVRWRNEFEKRQEWLATRVDDPAA
ncbi:MAG: PilZ domain-containing protein [Dehalococcoidia bacterium]